MFQKWTWPLFLYAACLFSPSAYALNQSFDHSAWGEFLKQFVNEKGEVDYQGAKRDSALLKAYLDRLAKIPEDDLPQGWPREEELALWINAYHASIIRVICEHYPITKINDIPGVWDLEMVHVGNEIYSLNRIRFDELTNKFRSEKINLALSCGARGCARLRPEPYRGIDAEGTLFQAAREFVNDPARNPIVVGSKKVRLSRIFKWYSRDFNLNFGVTENDRGLNPEDFSVLSFIAYYLEDPAKVQYLEEGNYKIEYLPFDWSLNEWVRNEVPSSGSPASS